MLREFLKKYRKNPTVQKDKEILGQLVEEGNGHLDKLKKIDQEILCIQKSTRTTFSFFAPVHNFCRTKYEWYYNWSAKPYATKIHVGVLSLVILLSIGVASSSLLSFPNKGQANIDFAPDVAEKNINYSEVYKSVKPDATEVVAKRTENQKVFQNTDGTQQYIISGGPLHYKDANNSWKNIDSSILAKEDNSGFTMDRSIYSADFSKQFTADPLVQISKDSQNLSMKPGELSFSNTTENQSISNPKNSEGVGDGHQITYKNAYGPGLDFSYETQDLQLNKKLNIATLESLPDPTVDMTSETDANLKFQLQFGINAGLELFIDDQPWDGSQTTIENKNLIFKKDGKTLWQLTPPKAWDASYLSSEASAELDDSNDQSLVQRSSELAEERSWITGKATISKTGDKINMSVLFPYSWLKTAQYPVTIDPDTYYGETTDGWIQGGNATYATARSTSVALYAGNTYFDLGQQYADPPDAYYPYRGFLEFNTSGIDDAATVTQANLYLTATVDWSTTNFTARIHKYNWTSPLAAGTQEADYDGALASTFDANWKNTADGDFAINTSFGSANLDTSWIQKGATKTQYALLSSRDVSATSPSGKEYIQIASQENATQSYRPYLSITAAAGPNSCQSQATGNWSDAGTWTACGGTTPQPGDSVTILDTHTITMTADASITTGSVTINSGGTLDTGNFALTATNITNAGTLTAGTGNTINVAGNWTNSNTFTKNTSTVNFTATDTGHTINPGASSFYNLTFNGSGGAWSPLTNTVTVTNDLTMTAGTFDTVTGTANVTVNGNVAGTTGIINMTTTNTFTQNVASNKNFGTTSGSTAWTFYNLTFTKSTGTPTITTSTTGTGDITINNVLNIAASTTFDAGNRIYHLMGTGTPFTKNGTFTSNISTISYENATSATITGYYGMDTSLNKYYNLQTNPASGTPTYTLKGTSTSFLAGTKVLMADGSKKNIEDIIKGDQVLSYNSDQDKKIASNVTDVTHGIKDSYYIINDKAKATANHIFILSDNSQKKVEDLKVGDILKTYSGQEIINTINEVGQRVDVFDISVDKNSLFYAEDFLVHNLGTAVVVCDNNFTMTGAGSAIIDDTTYSPNLSVNGNFTIGANQTFQASSTGNFMINGNYSNAGTFTAGTGKVTFFGTTTGHTINTGGTGTGKDFYNLSFSNTGAWSPLTNTLTVTNDLKSESGTFDTSSGTADVVVNGNVSCGATTCGTINMAVTNTFTQRVGAAGKTFGTNVVGSTNWTFNNLNFENSSAANLTVTTPGTATGQIIVNGTLTVGNASDTNTTTLDNEAYDRIIDAALVTITSKGVLSASSTASFTVSDNWANSGTFTAGTGTVTFDGTASGKTINGGASGFYTLTINGAGGGWTLDTSNLTTLTTLNVTLGTLNTGTLNIGTTTTTVANVNGGVFTGGSGTLAVKTLNVSSGTFTAGAGAVSVGSMAVCGDYTHSGGTADWTTNSSSLTYRSNTTKTLPADTYYTVTLNTLADADATYNLSGVTVVQNSLTISRTINEGVSYNTVAMAGNNLTVNGTLTINLANTLSMTSATLQLGGNYVNSGTLTPGTGTVEFTKGTGTQTLNSGGISTGYLFNNVIHSGAGTLQLVTNDLDINGDFTNSGGIFDTNGKDMTVAGSWLNSAAFTAGTRTVTFDGTATGKTINPGASSFYNLTFNGSGGAWSPLTNTVTVTNDLTMTAGTFDTSNGTANVAVNGTVAGTAGIINMTTTNTFTNRVAAAKNFGTTSGSTNWTFYNLNFENSSAGNLTVTAATGGTGQIIVGGTLTIGNASDTNTTTLDSNTNDRIIDVNGAVSITAKGSLTASSSASFTVAGNWTNAGTFTHSNGTVTFDGTATGKTINTGGAGAGKNFYDLIINGSGGAWTNSGSITATHNFTLTAGTFNFTGSYIFEVDQASLINGGTFVGGSSSTFLIGSMFDSFCTATLSISSGSFTAPGTVILYGPSYSHSSGTTDWLTNSSQFMLQGAGFSIPADHYYYLEADGYANDYATYSLSGDTTIDNGVRVIYNGYDATLAVGSYTLTTGTVLIDTFGTLSMTSGTVRVSGNFTNTPNGRFSSGTGTVEFTKSSGTQTLNSGGTDTYRLFNHVIHSGAGTLQLVTNNVDIDGNFINSGGTFDTNGKDMTVAGSWTNSATFTAGTRTVTFDGGSIGKTINPGASSFYNLTFNGSGGAWSPLTNTVTVTNDLTMTAGTFDTSNGTANVTVNGTVAGTAGVINMTTGTFTQRIGAAKNFGTTSGSTNWTFFNLNFENSSAGNLTVTTATGGTGQIIVGGTLTVGNASDTNTTTLDNETNDRIIDAALVIITSKGVLSASSTASFTVSDNWANSGTFTANSGTVTFDRGATTQTLTSGGTGATKAFNNLTHSGAGTLQLTDAFSASGNLTNSDGIFDANGQNISVTGNWNISGGSFDPSVADNPGNQTVNIINTGTSLMSGSNNFNKLNIDSSASTAGKAVNFVSGSTQTIASTLTLAGASGKVLTLNRSGGSGTDKFTLAIPTNMNSGQYINVTNSAVTGGVITPGSWTNVVNGGNNSGWNFDLDYPTIEYTSDPASANGSNGWFKGTAPTITLTATSDKAPVTSISYRWGASGNFTTAAASSISNITAPEGTNILYSYAVDEAENSGVAAPFEMEYKVDTAIPTADIYANPTTPNGTNSYYKTTAPSITFGNTDSGSGEGNIYYKWDSAAEYTEYSSEITAPEGVHTIHYYSLDNAGNSSGVIDREYKTDTAVPTISDAASSEPNGGNGWYKNTSPDITLSALDTGGSGVSAAKYRWGTSGDYSTYSTLLTAPEGTNTLYYYAIDNAGNNSETSSSTYKLDLTAPDPLNITPATTTPTNKLEATFIWTDVSDGSGSSVDYYLVTIGSRSGGEDIAKDQNSTTNSYTKTFTSSGTYYIRIKAVDKAGNISLYSKEGSVIIDQINPLLTIDNLVNGQYIKDKTFNIAGASSDAITGVDKVEVKFNDGSWNVANLSGDKLTWSYSWANYSDGSYTITARALDKVGNELAKTVFPIIVDTVAPSVPADLRVFNVSNTSAQVYGVYLDFAGSTDETSKVRNYELYRDGTKLSDVAIVKDTTNPAYTGNLNQPYFYLDQNLGTKTYSYKIRAIDNAGNLAETNVIAVDTTGKSIEQDVISEAKGTPSTVVTKDKTSAIVSWKTTYPATSLVEYGLSIGYGSKTDQDLSLNQGHSILINNLKPGTLYHAKATSKDIYGRETVSGDFTFTTKIAPEDKSAIEIIIQALQNFLNSLIAEGADTTNQSTSSQTSGAALETLQEFGNNLLLTDISFKEKGFYSYILTAPKGTKIEKSTDTKNYADLGQVSTIASGVAFDKNINQTTTYAYRINNGSPVSRKPSVGDDSPLVVTDASVVKESVFAAKDKAQLAIKWTTNRGSSSIVEFGTSSAYGQKTKEDTSLNMGHNVVLEGLNPDTTYHFKVTSTDSKGKTAVFPDFTYQTPAIEKVKTPLDIVFETFQKLFNTIRGLVG